MASQNIDVGDKVQWNYGGGHPQGTAAEIKDQPGEKVQIASQKGNMVTRNADEENPAVRVERRGEGNNNDVVKRMSELTKVGEGEGEGGEGEQAKEPVVGEKRGPSELTEETQGAEGEKAETTTTQEKTRKPRAKKAKSDTEVAKGEEHAKGAEASKPSKRGRGRGRGKAAASTGGRKPSTRSKKGSTSEAQEAAKETTVAEESGAVVDVVADVDAPGEPEQAVDVAAEDAPAGHTRSHT